MSDRVAEQRVSQEKPSGFFRGYKGIQEIRDDKLDTLAEWLKKFRPTCTSLTLTRKDYDLIARYPNTAEVLGFQVDGNGVSYKGFRLGFDKKPGRYQKP